METKKGGKKEMKKEESSYPTYEEWKQKSFVVK